MKLSSANIFRGDRGIWIIILFLFLYSVISVYSASAQLAFRSSSGSTTFFLLKQIFYLLIAVSAIVIVHNVPYKYFSRISVYLWYLSLALLVFTLIWGMNVNDARRWIQLPGGITFQTSDFAKLTLLMYLSRNLSLKEAELKTFKGVLKKIFVPIVITCGLIFPEDLSTAVLLFGISMLLVIYSRVKLKFIAMMLAIVLGVGLMLLLAIKAYPDQGRFKTWNNRFESFMDPNDQENIQEVHSKIAVATGGLFGKGPGKSSQRNILPHPYSDYIFAVIVEELGLIFGAIPLIALYLYLFLRSKKIVKKVNRKFGAYLTAGLSSLIVLQALSNMAVATNIFPVTGQSLPFVSYGGTSIFFTGIALGIILSVSQSVQEPAQEKSNNVETQNQENDE
ncbi:MAG: FtsW/RodA/SpoVE family cell cycle protein [Bacteroidales bacterium]|nr:FtsW/RodA/SpoVE family cell cycle protein [Bacteroidales bacterium]MDD4215768.1 FtsW/RodA/SpoVE family cell cycle protein [Bacteroidales bacterium]